MTDKVDCDIRLLLNKTSSRIRRDYSEMLRELNLYVGQDNFLYHLWSADGATQMELCEHLNCEPPTVTNMVKSLEQNGFVYRRKDDKDGRVMRIYLTQEGRALEQPVEKLWRNHQDKILKSISEEERLSLREILVKIESNLF